MAHLSLEKRKYLEYRALQLRQDSVRATTASDSGHPTSALSAADIIAALFFHVMKFDPKDPKGANNDRFILSKGHAIPVVYAAWKQVGVLSDAELMTLRKFDSVLEGHPTPRFPYNEAATGSLGQGLSIAAGVALNAKLSKLTYTTYAMMGDGEIAEGSIWEAAEFAAYHKLNNLVGIVDCNRLGQSEPTMLQHEVTAQVNKWTAFGWHTCTIDGHDIDQIVAALEQRAPDKPTMIIAKTFKGHGLHAIENKNGFHGKPLKPDECTAALEELRKNYPEAAAYAGDKAFHAQLPQRSAAPVRTAITIDLARDPNKSKFAQGEKLATRKAYGFALAALGRESSDVIVLDGDVKNSTFSETFEREFPDRFVQCFIAEQNMVGVSAGLELRGKIPFAATFACFLTRAFDQIRMAGIGRNALRLCGSHSGVSIGEDGPSQMGLEDLGMMRSVPNSIVFYPSDAVSTYKLVTLMANYQTGVSYLRTTRGDTPVIYAPNASFKIGGCTTLHQGDRDQACIIAAGITLHEALKAREELLKKDIPVSVIDLYCVKPLDIATIKKTIAASLNRVIIAEDHYAAGGIGEAVASALAEEKITLKHLCVRDIPRSGTPAELLAWAGIDAAAIQKAVIELT